jgi:predicted phosphoribosyltransferase
MMNKLSAIADDVIILETPDDFIAVSQVYEVFDQVTDEGVSELMKKADRKSAQNNTMLPML